MAISIQEAKEELKYMVDMLKRYYLDDYPIPSNSKALIGMLNKLLEMENTNSFYMASPETKTIALGIVLILLSHTADYPTATGGLIINDPKSLELLEPEDSIIRLLIDFVKKGLKDIKIE